MGIFEITLLTVLYLLGAFLYHAAAIGLGSAVGSVIGIKGEAKPFDLFGKLLLGQATISGLMVSLGLCSALTPPLVLLAILVPSTVGWMAILRSGYLRELANCLRKIWADGRGILTLNWIAALPIATLVLLSLYHLQVGGLAPDVGQDPLWYHLSTPGQWVLRGDISMDPHVMPSTYTLGGESLYIPLLFFGDEVLVTTWVAQIHILLYIFIILVVMERVAGLHGLLLGLAISFSIAVIFSRAPISTKHDVFCMLHLLAGWRLLVREWERPEGLRARVLILVGIFLGFALAVKVVALVYIAAIAGGFFLGALLTPGRLVPFLKGCIPLSIGLGIVFAPWLLRGYVLCGNPLIYLHPTLMPVKPEFLPVLEGYAVEPRRFPFTFAGMQEAFTDGIRKKIRYAGSSRDILFFLVPPIAILMAIMCRGIERICACVALLCYAGLSVLDGFNQLVRYFAISHVIAIPILCHTFRFMEAHLPGQRRLIPATVLLIGAVYTYITDQWRWGNFTTVRWGYRPIVTNAQRWDWAPKTELGVMYETPVKMQELLPIDAVLLLPDIKYPYYFKRIAYWTDPNCPPILRDWFGDQNAAESHLVLKAKGITHVVQMNASGTDVRFHEMEASSLLTPMQLPPGMETWRVWIVN